MVNAGDLVVVDFPGATGIKRRPAVVLSNADYHNARPDVILGVITSNTAQAITAFDHVLLDWQAAGLRMPSAFRTYIGMATPRMVHIIGRLSERDWQAVQRCCGLAL